MPDRTSYDALQQHAVVFTGDDLRWLAFDGTQAAQALTGLVTNDVLSLAVGTGQYAATLTAKGKMLADLRIFRTDETSFLTSAAGTAFDNWLGVVKKFVNPRLAKYAVRENLGTLAVHGPRSSAVVTAALHAVGLDATEITPHRLDALAPYAFLTLPLEADRVLVIASPELGSIPGFDIVAPATQINVVGEALREIDGIAGGDADLWKIARVEAGRPAYGADMTDATIPQEANLGELGALHFEKGCYTGQETVARVHFRGHVNRHLRRVRGEDPIPEGAELVSAEGKVVGDVRSSVVSPAQGPLAIAMIRREVEAGSALSARSPDGDLISVRLTE